MRAVGVNEYGGPDALEVVELPEPHAGPGEIRIRVHAAAVNPTDTYVRNGARKERQQQDPPPYVPGMDVAGVVDEVGEGVATALEVGDRVMAIVLPQGSHGGYAEHVVVPAESATHAPDGSSHAEACTLPMNGLTAQRSLDLLDLDPGDVLAVTGAAGAYGGYVVQLATLNGLTVVADAADSDRELVTRLGADQVVARGDDVADAIRSLHVDGVDGLADGSVQNELVVPAIKDGGAYTSVRGWSPDGGERSIHFTTTWVGDYAKAQGALDRLRQLAEDEAITLRVAEVFPPEQAAEAHRRLEAGGVRGRLVIEL